MAYLGDEPFCNVFNWPVVFHCEIMSFSDICVKNFYSNIVIYRQHGQRLVDDN